MAFTFNGSTKRILVDSSTPDVSVKAMYSDWKEWAVLSSNLGYAQAFRTFGGDPTVEGQTAPAYYFLRNGWRVVVDGFDATFGYNLYTDEGENPVITINGGTALINNSDVGIVKSATEKALEYGGIVYLDTQDGAAGDVYPYGTQASPVNNLTDALQVCSAYGFHKIQIDNGTLTVDEDLTGISLYGRIGVELSITSTATLTRTEFRGLEVSGDFNGQYVDLFHCEITSAGATNFNGHITSTAIGGDITVADGATVTINECSSYIAGLGRPTIHGAPNIACSISLRKYSGGLNIAGFTHAGCTMSAEFLAGKCTVLNSCTAGTISVRGVVQFTDESNGATVDDTATVSQLIDLSGVSINVGDIQVDAPTAAEIRLEMDTNSTKLASIDSNVAELPTDALRLPEFIALKD